MKSSHYSDNGTVDKRKIQEERKSKNKKERKENSERERKNKRERENIELSRK